MHILVIEDEEQLCRSIAEGLRMNGYETDTCFDGDDGLELCLTENYDLILLDLNLPGHRWSGNPAAIPGNKLLHPGSDPLSQRTDPRQGRRT